MKFLLLLLISLNAFAIGSTESTYQIDVVQGKHISTPSNPPAGSSKRYFKSDGLLYTLSSAGTEAAISASVSSVFGRTGAVVAANGDYTSAQITELTNLFFTNARGIAAVLTAFSSGAGTITSSDSVLTAIQKLDGNVALKLSSSLANGKIFIGNGSNIATEQSISADLAITNTGVATIANNAVTNAKAAQMGAHTFKGNNTASTANAIDLTATQLTSELNNVVGDSGSGGTKGLVPAPGAGDAAAGKFLKADGTFAVPSGSGGDVVGPSSASAGAIALFDGTTGKLIKQLAYGTTGQVLTVSGAAVVFSTPASSSGTVRSSSGTMDASCTASGNLTATGGTHGTGQCNYSITPVYSTTPRCWANSYSSAARFCTVSNVSTSGLEVRCFASTTGLTADTDFNVFCTE